MLIIDEHELKARLDRGERLTLVMFMDQAAFERAHIPGSVQCADLKEAMGRFSKDDPIVGYCSTDACVYSRRICAALFEQGYTKIIHFHGGLWAWEQAGFPLEGTMVKP